MSSPAPVTPPIYNYRNEAAPRSASYSAVVRRAARFARDETATILIEGASGTGKTRLARSIHEMSPRASGPFHHVVLSTLDDGVASSELFGHRAGAFTDARMPRAGHFVSAGGGTLFLDEIGKASPSIQGKLLHALEYGEVYPVGADRAVRVNARIVVATNLDLSQLVNRGTFLPDLYARLEAFRIVLPPLRERRADIALLVHEAVHRHAVATGYAHGVPRVDPALMEALRSAPWPNNVRQLDGVVHRIMLEAEGAATLCLAHCIDELSFLQGLSRRGNRPTRAEAEAVLRRADNNRSEASRILGVDRKTLRRILDEGDHGGEAQGA